VKTLLLFDIDGTLMLTGGAGGRAMAMAAQELFDIPDALQTIPMAGLTDAWIVAQMAERHGVSCDGPVLERFRARYLTHLRREMQVPHAQKGILPGVRSVLDALAPRGDTHVALLTGNFEGGARIKLDYFDLYRYFRGGAFGDDCHDRNALLAVALERVQQHGGPAFAPSETVVIGDTPLDIAVALAGGARSLGVATGGYPAEELRASGADIVLDDLSDLEQALAAMGVSRV
jgi:phosphoglycolate phosphatase-like HAD superfamily hydrolase